MYDAAFIYTNAIFSILNAVLATFSALLSWQVIKILSDQKALSRVKAGYFLSIDLVVLSWKLLFASSAVFAIQYANTTAFVLGLYAAETAYVLFATYLMETVFIILMFLAVLTNYQILKKYA